LIGPPNVVRGSVTSTATTPEPCIWPRCLGAGPAEAECSDGCAHAHDTPALCDISGLSGPVARGAEVGSTSAGGTVEGASDGARYRTVVADPPWPVAKRMGAGGRVEGASDGNGHGDLRYRRGCRCDVCTAAHAERCRDYRRRRAAAEDERERERAAHAGPPRLLDVSRMGRP
jgi:hypothetical protein